MNALYLKLSLIHLANAATTAPKTVGLSEVCTLQPPLTKVCGSGLSCIPNVKGTAGNCMLQNAREIPNPNCERDWCILLPRKVAAQTHNIQVCSSNPTMKPNFIQQRWDSGDVKDLKLKFYEKVFSSVSVSVLSGTSEVLKSELTFKQNDCSRYYEYKFTNRIPASNSRNIRVLGIGNEFVEFIDLSSIQNGSPIPVVPSLQIYKALQNALKTFITTANAPAFLRMSFHDVQNFNPGSSGGGAGCIFTQTVQNFATNNGLLAPAKALQEFVRQRFPNIAFPDGDIVSLAGKVAIDKRLNGCFRVRWAFGRKTCVPNSEQDVAAPATANTASQLKPFLDRYKFSLTDLAILVIGGHGYFKETANRGPESGITSFKFMAGAQAITDFISANINSQISNFGNWLGLNGSTIARFPIDMMFYPSTLSNVNGATVDRSSEMLNVEKQLMDSFVNNPNKNIAFHQKFVEIYARMLELGSNPSTLTAFEDFGTCDGNDRAHVADTSSSFK